MLSLHCPIQGCIVLNADMNSYCLVDAVLQIKSGPGCFLLALRKVWMYTASASFANKNDILRTACKMEEQVVQDV